MLKRKKKYCGRLYIFSFVLLVFALFGISPARTQDLTDYSNDPLILEPIIQGFNLDDYAYVYEKTNKQYISLPQISAYLGLKYVLNKNTLKLWWVNDEDAPFVIDLGQKTVEYNGLKTPFASDEMLVVDDTLFFTADFYIQYLDVKIKIDRLNMQLVVTSDKDLPTTVKRRAEKKRGKNNFSFKRDSFKNYEFDNRWFGEPVVDLTLGKGWNYYDSVGKSSNSDSYSVNVAMLAAGLDVNAYIFGDSYNDRNPRVRLTGSRTFLDEPGNAFNLKTLKVGDIY